MKEAQRKYKKKVTTKRVDFYPREQALITFVQSVNFAQFVKNKIKEELNNGKDI